MKYIFSVLTITLLLSACGDNESSKSTSSNESSSSQSSKQAGKLLACSVLSENYITSTYKDAIIIEMKEGGRSHPLCSSRFEYEGVEHGISLTLGVIGEADESYLEASTSYFKEKGRIEEITGVGEKAYNRTGGADQISAISNQNLIHVSAYKASKYDLEFAKKVTNDMFKILE